MLMRTFKRRRRDEVPDPKLTTTPLEALIGHQFLNRQLLAQALTHRSALGPKNGSVTQADDNRLCNERLEFLGDAVLGLCISYRLMQRDQNLDEGQLSRMRAALVNEAALAAVAGRIDLGSTLLIGKGERQSGGAQRQSLLADALEAVIGAVFEDAGFAAADAVVGRLFASALADDAQLLAQTDFKTVLQELTQEKYKQTPTYMVRSESGPDHKKIFDVMVMLGEQELGRGRGASKKRASQAAAQQALQSLRLVKHDTLGEKV